MADKVVAGPVSGANGVREAVCIHTKKIYSSCRDKDCIEDLRAERAEHEPVHPRRQRGAALYLCRCGAGELQPGLLHGGYALFLPRHPAGNDERQLALHGDRRPCRL